VERPARTDCTYPLTSTVSLRQVCLCPRLNRETDFWRAGRSRGFDVGLRLRHSEQHHSDEHFGFFDDWRQQLHCVCERQPYASAQPFHDVTVEDSNIRSTNDDPAASASASLTFSNWLHARSCRTRRGANPTSWRECSCIPSQ
jgi:hypothetical protein